MRGSSNILIAGLAVVVCFVGEAQLDLAIRVTSSLLRIIGVLTLNLVVIICNSVDVECLRLFTALRVLVILVVYDAAFPGSRVRA